MGETLNDLQDAFRGQCEALRDCYRRTGECGSDVQDVRTFSRVIRERQHRFERGVLETLLAEDSAEPTVALLHRAERLTRAMADALRELRVELVKAQGMALGKVESVPERPEFDAGDEAGEEGEVL
jgi:hypothetical protein